MKLDLRSRTVLGRVALAPLAIALLTATVAREARGERSSLSPTIGYNYSEIETPRTAAMGGANRAVSSSAEALFLNPANMASSRVYHLGAFAQVWPEASRQSYGLAAVDSLVNSAGVAGGLGGTWNFQDPDGVDRESIDLRMAFAFPFSDKFFVGLGGRYLMLAEHGEYQLAPSRASAGLDDERIVNGFSFDGGATIKPSDEFAISIVGSNLTNPGTGFQPTSVAGGIGYGSKSLTLEADLLADFTTWEETTMRAMAGFEFLAADSYPLRLGYRFDEGAESHAIAAGVGYIDRAFAAELGARRTVVGEAATTIVIGFKYHLEASGAVGEGF